MVLSDKIRKVINWFYIPAVSRIVPHQTFLYAVCGGGNMFLNWVLYSVIYNFVLHKEVVHLGFISFSAHIMTCWIVVPITSYTGFWLNKYVTFTESKLRTRVQLIRYFISVMGSMLLSLIGLKFFVDVVGIYPTPSYILTSCISVIYSYLMQKYFTFRKVG